MSQIRSFTSTHTINPRGPLNSRLVHTASQLVINPTLKKYFRQRPQWHSQLNSHVLPSNISRRHLWTQTRTPNERPIAPREMKRMLCDGHFRQGDFFPSHTVSHLSLVPYGKPTQYAILITSFPPEARFRSPSESTRQSEHTTPGAALLSIISFRSREEKKILCCSRLKHPRRCTRKITPAAFLHNHLRRNNWKRTDYHGSFKTS